MIKEKCEKGGTCNACNQSSSWCQQEKEVYARERLKSNLSHIKHRFLVMSGKGGGEKAGVRDMKKGGGKLSFIERRDYYARI
jgi:hypothetical protein